MYATLGSVVPWSPFQHAHFQYLLCFAHVLYVMSFIPSTVTIFFSRLYLPAIPADCHQIRFTFFQSPFCDGDFFANDSSAHSRFRPFGGYGTDKCCGIVGGFLKLMIVYPAALAGPPMCCANIGSWRHCGNMRRQGYKTPADRYSKRLQGQHKQRSARELRAMTYDIPGDCSTAGRIKVKWPRQVAFSVRALLMFRWMKSADTGLMLPSIFITNTFFEPLLTDQEKRTQRIQQTAIKSINSTKQMMFQVTSFRPI